MWREEPLINLAKYINGFAFKPEHWQEDGVKIVRIEQLNKPEGNYDYCKIKIPSKNLIDSGDLIFSWSATLKAAIWRHGPSALNQHLFKVVPYDWVEKYFLFQILDFYMDKLSCASHGSTMKHIKRGELEKFTVRVPDIQIQREIANVLKTVNRAIEKTEALIAKYDQIKQGMMQDLFTRGVDENGQLRPAYQDAPHLYDETALGWVPKEWKIKSFGEEVDVIDPNPSHRYPESTEYGVPICSTANFNGESNFDLSNAEQVPNSTFLDQDLRCKFVWSDVVFARKGRIGLARRYGSQRKVFSHTVVLMKTKRENVSEEWLLWLARSTSFLGGIEREMNTNLGVPTLGVAFIKSIRVPFPTYNEQRSVNQKLDKISQKIDALNRDCFKLVQIKEGLMQDLLTGTVRVSLDREVRAEAVA